MSKQSKPVIAEATLINPEAISVNALPLPPGARAAEGLPEGPTIAPPAAPTEVAEKAAQAVAAAVPGLDAAGVAGIVAAVVGALAPTLGASIASGMAQNAPPRRKTFGEWVKTQPKKPALQKNVYQNGFLLTDANLSAEEIDYVNRITHSGRYFNRRVEVIVEEGSGDVHIRYSNKTPDQRMDNKDNIFQGGGLKHLLMVVAQEQELEDQESTQRADERARRRA